MARTKSILKAENSGYSFIALFGLALAGFWPSYFSKFFHGTNSFNFYFHFHVVMVVLWIFALVIQPILIRKRKIEIHRIIGKSSYILFPLMFISVLLLIHNQITGQEEDLGLSLFVPFKDLLIMAVGYWIAIKYRHTVALHARGMIVTGIVFIEPALVRFIDHNFISLPIAYAYAILIIYSLMVALIVLERKQKKGRWVFPLTLGLYVIVHAVIVFQMHIGPWEAFSKWFAALPLT